jgi:hypothetical protein
MTAVSDLIEHWRPTVIRTIQYGQVIWDGYQVRETYLELANQERPATLRQKVGLVFNLINLTSSVVDLAYQPKLVIQQSRQENEKCNHCVKTSSDFIDRFGEQPILRESLENCRACVVLSTSQYQSSNMILLSIRMASIAMLFISRSVENEPPTNNRKFTISTGLQMLIMIDLLSKIYSDSCLKPQKYLALVLRSLKTPQSIAGIYLQMLQIQQILKLRTQNHV